MERMWRGVGRSLGNRTWLVLGIAVVITVVTVGGAAQLDFATGQDSYLQPDSREAVTNEEYQELFGGETVKKTAFKITRMGQLVAQEASRRLEVRLQVLRSRGCPATWRKRRGRCHRCHGRTRGAAWT